MADPLPSARTPCPLPAVPLSGLLCPAPSPGVTDAALYSAAADTAAARIKANLLDLQYTAQAADQNLSVSAVPHGTETGVTLQEVPAPTAKRSGRADERKQVRKLQS